MEGDGAEWQRFRSHDGRIYASLPPGQAGRCLGIVRRLEHKIVDFAIQLAVILFAISFHESAHAWSALRLGDDTAKQLGRVSFNPLKHIDPMGTIVLPGLLLLLHSSFLFGYAKPVPINFRALHNPRLDMVWVAAAGPAMNIVLAVIAALLPITSSCVPRTMTAVDSSMPTPTSAG